MAKVIWHDVAAFLRQARRLGATPVLKMFLVRTPELPRVRCEHCGRVMRVSLQGTSRPQCWHEACPSNAEFKGEPSMLYHVFPPEEG